ncbi:hypothetical protein BACCIP111895_00629 [Neobacillus rhizosphaerae]|uniref:Uncharacterized protein n=1 Tax=Neobacillus rhizosphaerae TaxID=2880965 RepID=A0ABM9ELL7_9BACI|nr:hypothetical protein BACCIP111895_00629 [Neobacillus rhizosphaerae]
MSFHLAGQRLEYRKKRFYSPLNLRKKCVMEMAAD